MGGNINELSVCLSYFRWHILSKVGKIKTRDICILFRVLEVTSIIIKSSCLWGMKVVWRRRLDISLQVLYISVVCLVLFYHGPVLL